LSDASIYRKHTGNLDGAIDAMVKSIAITRTKPRLAEETALNLNFLADLYLLNKETDHAETAIRESIVLARPHYPHLLAANLWILASIQFRKGEIPQALASAEESRRLCQEANHSYGVSQADELIGSIKKSETME
jgi:ATP/maltotriose-dependent transcriptional regulator MalT